MGIFDSLGGNGAPQAAQRQMTPEQQRQAMQEDVSRIKSGPAAFLHERGYKIPDNMTDAGQITQYLIQSGQIGGARYQAVMQMLGGIRR